MRLEGSSVALGVISPLCATLGPVPAGPEGCSRGRWRSGPSKWRHTATPESRGQGAPRTCRCIETLPRRRRTCRPPRQGAPRTCRCIETRARRDLDGGDRDVREHHAPVGALRHDTECHREGLRGQGAPRTCRCIETSPRPVGSGRTTSSSPSSSAAGSRRVAYEWVGRTGPRGPGSQR